MIVTTEEMCLSLWCCSSRSRNPGYLHLEQNWKKKMVLFKYRTSTSKWQTDTADILMHTCTKLPIVTWQLKDLCKGSNYSFEHFSHVVTVLLIKANRGNLNLMTGCLWRVSVIKVMGVWVFFFARLENWTTRSMNCMNNIVMFVTGSFVLGGNQLQGLNWTGI